MDLRRYFAATLGKSIRSEARGVRKALLDQVPLHTVEEHLDWCDYLKQQSDCPTHSSHNASWGPKHTARQ